MAKKEFKKQNNQTNNKMFPYIVVAEHHNKNKDIIVKDLTVETPGLNSHTLIENLSMTINQGERVILTGASGTGKTTVAKALLNQWDYGTGTVLMPSNVKIMAQSQQAYFPNTTLKTLLNMTKEGKEIYSDKELRKALQKVGHDKLIQHIPGQQIEILMDCLLTELKELDIKKGSKEDHINQIQTFLNSRIPELVKQQFNIVQFTPQEQRDYLYEGLSTVLKSKLKKPLEDSEIKNISDNVSDTLDTELVKPLCEQLIKTLPDTAARVQGKHLKMTSLKSDYYVWNLKNRLNSKLRAYMRNEDTDDFNREIRINKFQAQHVLEQVTKSMKEELDKLNSNTILSKVFNTISWPFSISGSYFKAGDLAQRLTENLTIFMDRQILTGENMTLSGGEKQKLMIAMALLHKPDILILDEITAALDRPTGEKLYSQMLEQIPKHTTVISIAHNEHILKYHTLHAHLENKTITLTPVEKAVQNSPKPSAP